MKILQIIAIVCVVIMNGCTKTTIIEEERFKVKTLAIKDNFSCKEVKKILGAPDYIQKNDDNRLLSRLKSDIVWGYFHPGYATISFVVGFKSKKVGNIGMYDSLGTATNGPIVGQIESVNEFWGRIAKNESPHLSFLNTASESMPECDIVERVIGELREEGKKQQPEQR